MAENKLFSVNKLPELDTVLETIGKYQSAKNVSSLLEIAVENLKTFGYSQATYHTLPPIGNYSGNGLSRYYSHNISQDAQTEYYAHYKHKVDPIIQYVMDNGSPIWLSEIQMSEGNEHNDFIASIVQEMGDGLAIPLFGPSVCPGYAFLALGQSGELPSNARKWITYSTANVFHIRYCLLTNKMADKINLTIREMEVLELIFMGKTNPEIATILSISKHTVNSYTKTLFLKFGTTDRVSTVIKAMTQEVGV